MRILLPFFFSVAILLVFLYPSNYALSNQNGSPGGKTGSPADIQTCTQCHSGTINTGMGQVEIITNIPPTGYSPGEIYEITININDPGFIKFGFELTAEDSFSNKVGSFLITNSTETKSINNSVTHKVSGTSGVGQKTWNVGWTISSVGIGDVTFYASCMSANANNSNAGDKVYTTSSTVSEQLTNYTNEDNIISVDRKLIKIVNPLSSVTKKSYNQPLFYIYNDGTVEKKIIIK